MSIGEMLAKIWGTLQSGFETLASSAKGFAYMLEIVIDSLAIPPMIRPFLPTFFGVAITTVIVISVIKAIFGR